MDNTGESESPYILEPHSKVWMRPRTNSKANLADASVESAGDVIRGAEDIACGSEELLAAVHDWHAQLQFGSERSNILRPVQRFLQERVLEVGSECGALTRFLGELGSEVVALEPDVQKATVSAARCRGLANVTVVCDEFARARVPGPFKAVSLIGGLGWALYPTELLEWCGSLLADDGILLVAAENRLALKNFAGAPEDHTGGIFHGVTGLDGMHTGRSFGRQELKELLHNAGLPHCEFLYPLPNYRFARMILHTNAFRSPSGALALDLVQRFSTYYDPRWNYERLFSERRAWATVLRNGLAEDLAPSFLVLATKESRPLLQPDVLAYSYSTARRRCFQKETLIWRKNDSLSISRTKLYDVAPPAGMAACQELRDEQYEHGRLWANELHERLDKPNWTFHTILDWFDPYLDFLMQHVDGHNGGPQLPPNFLDCTPFNVVRKSDGTFVAFDLEWVSQAPIPLDFLLFRGLFYTLNETITVARPDYIQDLHILDIVVRLIRSSGLQIDDARIIQLFEFEEAQQKVASGNHATLSRSYWTNACLTPRLEDVRAELRRRDSMISEAEQAVTQRMMEEHGRKLAALDEQTARREARVEELIRESARQAGRAAAAESSLSATTTELRAHEEETSRLTERIVQLDSYINELVQKLRAENYRRIQFERRATRLHAELGTAKSAEQRAAGLEHELGMIRTSWSWRLTLPLRKFADLGKVISRLMVSGAARLRFAWLCRSAQRRRTLSVINESRLFDEGYYAQQGADVEDSGIPALVHYFLWGAAENRSPHPLFDAPFYREQSTAGDFGRLTPLEHYIQEGWKKGKDPHPLFNSSLYLQQNPDVAQSGMNPLVHYLMHGSKEGRWRHPWFNAAWYLDEYPDVRRAGVDPLFHYLLCGAKEGRDPSPTFDSDWYLAVHPGVADSGLNPLVHYVRFGRSEGRATQPGEGRRIQERLGEGGNSRQPATRIQSDVELIEPFFDIEFYIRQCADFELSETSPFEHYLKKGAAAGRDPHPLFDTSFYLENNPGLASHGTNPLLHFAVEGGQAGLDPHPLFDSSYYLETYRDIAKSGLNPLLHYLQTGALEGRNPNRLFDGAFYLRTNPDVAHARLNPLVHFLEFGGAESRRPHPAFDVDFYRKQHPETAKSGLNPLMHYFETLKSRSVPAQADLPVPKKSQPSGLFRVDTLDGLNEGTQGFDASRTILCVTHVPPYPPRAGNEYAEYRQLSYFERQGYRIVIALSPLPGEEISSEQFRAICNRFPYTILCSRDGLIQHRLPEGQAILNALDGAALNPLAVELGEDLVEDPQERWLIAIERTFCHDFLARLVIHLEAALAPCIVLSMYIFQTRFLPLIGRNSLKIVDTIDMFSTTQRKVVELGVKQALNITADQERRRLLRGDVILACQHAEAEEFTALVPERLVLEVPFDFDVVQQAAAPSGSGILYVASDNAPNTKGLRDFLHLAWPIISRRIPQAELLVAGRVCRTVERPPEGVRLLGLVDDLKPLYEQARLTINPAVAGTGMKIKTAESLSNFRPVVGWPASIDGFQFELAELCHTARDWPTFADHVVSILRTTQQDWFSAEQKNEIRRLLSPDTIYGPLLRLLDTYAEAQGLNRFTAKALAKCFPT
jgi:SAM-dependent methyltransferase